MNPIDIACRQCAAQPGDDCENWSEVDGRVISVPGLVHPERIEDFAWKQGVEAVQQEPTKKQYEDAIHRSDMI